MTNEKTNETNEALQADQNPAVASDDDMTTKKGGLRRKLLPAILILLVIGLIIFRIASSLTPIEEEERQAVNVEVTQATISSVSVTTPLSGRVEPEDTVSVISPLQAEITNVYVKVGDWVNAGAPIFTVDTTQQQFAYDQVLANYNMAVDGLETASTNLERMRQLYQEGAVSLQQYEQTQSLYDTAVQTLNQAQASLNSSADALGKGTVTAPISGYLTSVNVVKGSYPPTAMAAAEIASTNRLEINTNVSEYLVGKVNVGDSVDVYIKSLSEEPFKGTVRTKAQAPSTGSLTYPISVTLNSGQGDLMAGMFAEVHIVSESRNNVLTIPSDAVMVKGGKSIVVVLQGKIPMQKEIETGLDDGHIIEVKSGINAGDTIVCVGQEFIIEGEEVNIVNSSANTAE